MTDQISADELVGKEMADILRGCTAGLIKTLSSMNGNTVQDLTVTLQLMPFGDRAVLLAYDCVSKDRQDRWTALPKMVDLVDAAHEVHEYLLPQITGEQMHEYLA